MHIWIIKEKKRIVFKNRQVFYKTNSYK
jgi:hypothetical protein